MEQYIWLLFPIVFIFHDMEEIIGMELWIKKNKKLLEQKYPAILKTYANFSTEGFAFAVYEELIVCMFFSFLALFTSFIFCKLLWFGIFVGCTLHFLVHIVQAIIIGKYIPALVTSLMCSPISVFIIYKSISLINCNLALMLIFSIVGTFIIGVNLKFAHYLMKWFGKKIKTLS